MLYRPILKKALWISWKNKFLWIFGFFVMLFLNNGIPNLFEFYFRTESFFKFSILFFVTKFQFLQSDQFRDFFLNIQKFFLANLFVSVFIFLFILLIFSLFVWLSIVSQASLIGSAEKINSKKISSLKESFREGKIFFWPLFVLNLLAKLFTFGLIIIFIIFLSIFFIRFQKISFWLDFLFLSALVILFFLDIVISFFTFYASAFVVLKKEKIFQAIKKTWFLFLKNWLISLEMAFILLFVFILSGLALFLVLIFFSLPFVLLTLIFYYFAFTFGFNLTLNFLLFFLIIILTLFASFLAVFGISSWTLLFIELTKKEKKISKLIRLFGNRFTGEISNYKDST